MPHLQVADISKQFGAVKAVDYVSFEAKEGRILGLLGPNGAGKTTCIRMIAYITVPDSGRVLLDGREVGPWSQRVMGYLPEERGLYKKMKVGEQLTYFGELKGLSRSQAVERTRHWLGRFDAEDWFGRKTGELSKGMQQKVQFIATILHDPSLLILDEPFGGLDPLNADLLEDVLMELKSDGRIILFASHRMEQVEQLCDDICLISDGRIVLDGSLRDVKRSFGRNTVLIAFDGPDTFLDDLEREGRIRVGTRSLGTADLQLLDGTSPRLVLERALSEVSEVSRFELVEPPLREIFVTVVQNQRAAEQETSRNRA
jgi:ABC-2 type transport system ATP-binding protein